MSRNLLGANTTEAYVSLVQKSSQFLSGESDGGVQGFPAVAKSCLRSVPADFNEAVAWLAAANDQADLVPVEALVKDWIPFALHTRTREISWCLPAGRATQPFFDEYITHCRQNLVNALLVPRSSIKALLDYAHGQREWSNPAGFIFHLSRCGSTLASGCLAALDRCSVVSESSLLTEILLAQDISRADKQSLLRLTLQLQGRLSSNQPHLIVKWNAWDLCYWKLVRDIWPEVPVLLLTRSPVEILASHSRSAGRHMSGDPALASVDEVFARSGQFNSLLDFRIAVLHTLMVKMLQIREQAGVTLLDYVALDERALINICRAFGIEVPRAQKLALRHKFTLNSKHPHAAFQPDSESKRRQLPEVQIRYITRSLSDLHNRLILKVND